MSTNACIVGIGTVLCLCATTGQAGLAAQPADTRLTTVLSALARVVPQEEGAEPVPRRAGAASRLSGVSLPASVEDALHGRRLRIDASDAAQVYVLMAVTEENLRTLKAGGAVVELSDPARRRVQASVPVSRLQWVAQLPFVDAVRLPTYARRRTGSVTTEGDAILHTADARGQLGLDGTGVRVGVVSDGLKGVFATGCTSCAGVAGGPIEKGDLPTATGTRSASGVLTGSTGGIVGRSFQANSDLEGLPGAACGFPGAGAEGTALLEIVHDVAPAARLSFANADTDLAFTQAVNFLAASNDVVLDDLGFYGEPYDGTSSVSANTAAALNNPAFPVRAYFTAVGNDADEHYYGLYTDSGVDGGTVAGITTPGHLHLFQRTSDTTDVLGLGPQPYNAVRLPQNAEIAIYLTWDDPFGGSSNDYDLYLVQQSTGRVVASSTDVQSGRQDPVESIDYVNRGSDDAFRIVVQNVRNAAQPRHLNIFSFAPECATAGPALLAPPRHERHNFNTATHSIAAESDAAGQPAGVISVGAVCSASAAAAGTFGSSAPDESCLDTSNGTAEFFSSRGPTLDGRMKPDITGVDGVSVTGAGAFDQTFFGTSAAAPHLGGLAALLLQGAPCLLGRSGSSVGASGARVAVHDLILRHAASLSEGTPDNTFGFGRADALASVQATLPTRQGPSTFVVDGNSPFGAAFAAADLGFSDPNQCDLTKLSWSGGCGTSPGPTMTCPFGASSVSVSASNNNVSFSPATDLQITVTDFLISLSPASASVTAGQPVTFTVVVQPQGGPFRSAVTLGCGNLPPQTTCAFDPPTVTPASATVRSTLTISTVAAAARVAPSHDRDPFVPVLPSSPLAVAAIALFSAAVLAATRRSIAGPVLAAAAGATALGLAVLAAPFETGASAFSSGIALFPASIDFGSQTVGTTAPPHLVFLTNIGADTLNISGIVASGDFSQTTSCGTTVASSSTCQVAISFTPTTAGARGGALSVADNASGSPHVVVLTGTGVAAPDTGGSTPAGDYAVTINGVSGTLTHTASLTLSVH